MLGKLIHLGFDALLISAFLAGIKRSTGLMPALSQVPNKDVRREYASLGDPPPEIPPKRLPTELLRSYLEVGEYAFDFAVVIFGRSSSFERKH